jgi:hypothetical protein
LTGIKIRKRYRGTKQEVHELGELALITAV